MLNSSDIPELGIGLRPDHHNEIFHDDQIADWYEIISENFMDSGGAPKANLEKLLDRFPVVMHSTTLALGSSDVIDFDYLKKLKRLARLTKTPWISDYLSWGRVPGAHYHDLLPLPFTQEVIDYVAERARIVQDYLEVPFALENISSYLEFNANEMSEWEFYSAVVEKADINMALGVSSVYISSRNHGFDPHEYIESIPFERVIQICLAPHAEKEEYGATSCDNTVWDLFAKVYPKTKRASTLLEWDNRNISFDQICLEVQKAKSLQKELVL